VGVYETYDGQVVSILDARAAACVEPQHQNGNLIPDMSRDAAAAEAANGSARR
jgi:hypothetical protein